MTANTKVKKIKEKIQTSKKYFAFIGHTWRAVVHGDCYYTITVYLHKTPVYPNPWKCLLRNDHRGPRLNEYDRFRFHSV